MGTRRPNNDGTIYYREGRKKPWVGQVVIPGGKRVTKSFKLQRDAKSWLDEMKTKVRQGMGPEKVNLTLKKGYEIWLQEGKQFSWRPKTYKGYAGRYEIYIRPNLNSQLKLIEVKPHHIRALIRAAAASGAKGRTLELVRGNLHTFFEDLQKGGFVQFNPVKPVQVSYEPEQVQYPLNDTQIAKFLEAAQSSRLWALYYVALKTGMRAAELFGLMWQDVDFKNRSLYIRRQFAVGDNGRELSDVKTSSSRRRIRLGIHTCQLLQEHQQKLVIESQGVEDWVDQDMVFPSTVGTPLYPSNVRRNFKLVLERAGLPSEVRFHDLRHTMASVWLRKGANPKIVQERLGHSSARVTLDIYSHLTPTIQAEKTDDIDEFIAKLAPKDNLGDGHENRPNAAKLQRDGKKSDDI